MSSVCTHVYRWCQLGGKLFVYTCSFNVLVASCLLTSLIVQWAIRLPPTLPGVLPLSTHAALWLLCCCCRCSWAALIARQHDAAAKVRAPDWQVCMGVRARGGGGGVLMPAGAVCMCACMRACVRACLPAKHVHRMAFFSRHIAQQCCPAMHLSHDHAVGKARLPQPHLSGVPARTNCGVLLQKLCCKAQRRYVLMRRTMECWQLS